MWPLFLLALLALVRAQNAGLTQYQLHVRLPSAGHLNYSSSAVFLPKDSFRPKSLPVAELIEYGTACSDHTNTTVFKDHNVVLLFDFRNRFENCTLSERKERIRRLQKSYNADTNVLIHYFPTDIHIDEETHDAIWGNKSYGGDILLNDDHPALILTDTNVYNYLITSLQSIKTNESIQITFQLVEQPTQESSNILVPLFTGIATVLAFGIPAFIFYVNARFRRMELTQLNIDLENLARELHVENNLSLPTEELSFELRANLLRRMRLARINQIRVSRKIVLDIQHIELIETVVFQNESQEEFELPTIVEPNENNQLLEELKGDSKMHSHMELAATTLCPICIEAFEVGDTLRRLPGCGHRFHLKCIDEWLKEQSVTCPLCRNDVRKTLGLLEVVVNCDEE